MREITCDGPVYGDCEHAAIASADTESWSFPRTVCAEHVAPVLSGSCGYGKIEYFDGRAVEIFIERVDGQRRVIEERKITFAQYTEM